MRESNGYLDIHLSLPKSAADKVKSLSEQYGWTQTQSLKYMVEHYNPTIAKTTITLDTILLSFMLPLLIIMIGRTTDDTFVTWMGIGLIGMPLLILAYYKKNGAIKI